MRLFNIRFFTVDKTVAGLIDKETALLNQFHSLKNDVNAGIKSRADAAAVLEHEKNLLGSILTRIGVGPEAAKPE